MERPSQPSLSSRSDLDAASQEYLSELLSDFVDLRARLAAHRQELGDSQEYTTLEKLEEIAGGRVRELRWLLERSSNSSEDR